MRHAVVGGLLALLWAAPAAAQEAGSEWQLTVDPSKDLTLATASYVTGQTVAVRCQAGVLDVLVIGLPAFRSATRYMETTYGAHDTEAAHWFSSPDGALTYSPAPAMAARRLREGGRLQIAAAVSADANSALGRYNLGLPEGAASIDRVLTACNEPLTKTRDALPRWRQARVMSSNMWRRQPEPEIPEAAYATTTRIGFAVLSCVVNADGRPVDCDVEYQSDRRTGFGQSALRAMRTARVDMGAPNAPRAGELMVTTVRYQF